MSEDRSAKPWDLFNRNIGRVATEVAQKRLDICKGCDHFIKVTAQCKKCSCFMTAKTKLPHAECPIGKWGRSEPDNYVI